MKYGANTTTRNPVSSSLRATRGFTLIELLVVIGIIAALIGLLVPLIRKVQTSARGAATQAQLVTIGNAIQQYYGDFHAYPGPLLNSQLAANYYPGTLPAGVPLGPTVPDPFNPGQYLGLTLCDSTTNPPTNKPLPPVNEEQHITGSENLVLGLIGGLQLRTMGGTTAYLEYSPALIFPDGVTPNPTGALSLNYQKPKRFQAYLQVRTGDISHPNSTINNGQFTDNTGIRHAKDSIIPEFVDQYSDQMPILYLRSNPGGTAIAGYEGQDENGPLPSDPSTGQPAIPQYDISQIVDYTRAADKKGIFTSGSDPYLYHHGLQYVGDFVPAPPPSPFQPKDDITNGLHSNLNPGANALAYFKDPNNPGTQNVGGHARQKDAFILISAGPDRLYGTDDDIIYPGSLQP